MSKINVLSFEVANLIAAGEVVDRPASVLKELLENAIDSGADAIVAEIKKGGVSSIRVTDNGCGMDSSDLPLAIKRHATSKISKAEDLESIFTLGFRGEALAAISSVTKLTIISKTIRMENAVMLVSDCGEVKEITEIGANNGTTVLVEDLFANFPARRKFLKKNATEASAALAIAERVAMSRPDISFKFLIDGNLKFSTSGDGKLQNALYSIFGRDFATRLIAVDSSYNGQGITIKGFVGRSDNVRNTRNMQNVFINSRYVKSKTVVAALEQGFASFIAPERFPVCALFIDIDPRLVDVNVHPAKLEVKFSDEKKIFESVYYAVRTALSQSEYRAEIELKEKPKQSALEKLLMENLKTTSEQLTFADVASKKPQAQTIENENASKTYARTDERPAPQNSAKSFYDRAKQLELDECDTKTSLELLRAYKESTAPSSSLAFASPSLNETVDKYEQKSVISTEIKDDRDEISAKNSEESVKNTLSYAHVFSSEDTIDSADSSVQVDATPTPSDALDKKYKIIGEAFLCYIMVEKGNELIIIDKHAAHERILFEQLKRQTEKNGAVNSQSLIIPINIVSDDFSCALMREFMDDFVFAGFDIVIKHTSVDLYAIPDGVSASDAEELFGEISRAIIAGSGNPARTFAARREKSLYQIACKAAIKAGRNYDEAHIEWLVEQVMSMPDITVCPHGRPIAMTLTKNELDRRFNRLK